MSMFFESVQEAKAANPLPPMGVNPNTITFAGDSGGSYMSTTMHAIHSATVKGAGLMIGGPYAFDWLGYQEQDIPETQLATSFALVESNFKAGLIDDPANLKGAPAMVVSGTKDKTIPMPLQNYLLQWYANYGGVTDHITHNMGHTTQYEDPYNCFKFLYENIPATGHDSETNPVKPGDYDDMSWKTNGILVEYSQRDFVEEEKDWVPSNFAEKALLYYPKQCVDGTVPQCHLQVALHGCYENGRDLTEQWYGWTSVAYRNNVVLLIPQTAGIWYPNCWNSSNTEEPYCPSNSDVTCDATNALTNEGLQPKAFMAMIKRLTEPRDPNHDYYANNVWDQEQAREWTFKL